MSHKNTVKPLLLMIWLGVSLGYSQSPKADFEKKMDAYSQALLKNIPNVPGFALAVVKGDQVLLSKGYGMADLEANLKASAQTDYYIASSTKSFTGLLALILDKEGILSLDAPFASFFPDVKFPESLQADKVKLRELLCHTSGMDNAGIGFRVAYTGDHNPQVLNELVKYTRANKEGRGNYRYTNVGYNLYTLILENETGKKWQDYLAEKVFEPLGMRQTSAYMSQAKKNNWPVARPYISEEFGKIEEGYLMKKDNTMQSAGGMITTAEDLSKWLRVQINAGMLDGKQIFPASLIKNSHKAWAKTEARKGHIFKEDGYGMGWSLGKYQGRREVHHFGGFPGFYTHVSFLPEDNLGIAVLINEAATGYTVMNYIAESVYDYFLKGSPDKWETDEAKKLEELTAYAKKRMQAAADHRAERAKRTWQLSHSFDAYTGVFKNEEFGKITISVEDKHLFVKMGNLHCFPTPFVKKETIRVEMTPGSGEVLQYVWKDEKIVGIEISGDYFKKIQ